MAILAGGPRVGMVTKQYVGDEYAALLWRLLKFNPQSFLCFKIKLKQKMYRFLLMFFFIENKWIHLKVPIRLQCNHLLCQNCFEQLVEFTTLSLRKCPKCRRWIGVARRTTDLFDRNLQVSHFQSMWFEPEF